MVSGLGWPAGESLWMGGAPSNQSSPSFFSFHFLSHPFPAGDGNVSFEEFVDILSNMTYEDKSGLSSADQEERELRDAFRVFDKHNRGYITASDLRAVLQCLGEDLDEEDSKLWPMCSTRYVR